MEVCNPTAPLGTEAPRAEDTHTSPFECANAQAGQRVEGPASDAATAILNSWIASDHKSLELLERAKRAADSAFTVLIRGETGVGKDLLAQVMHYAGSHANEPLVKVDCGSLPPSLVESELFGQERGAVPGATPAKRGRLETAGRGTLVLDEIAALSMPIQVRVLRVLEEKTFQRMGGSRNIEVDARIIALTSIDLERAVSRRSFREDLYYRLTVNSMVVPPLRERVRDVRPLVKHLLRQLAEIHRRPEITCASVVFDALEHYDYPGNVRELRNLMERAVIQGAGAEITVDDLPPHVRRYATDGRKRSLEDLEREYIAEILTFTRGKKTRAAAILGISRKTLLEKRKRYGLG